MSGERIFNSVILLWQLKCQWRIYVESGRVCLINHQYEFFSFMLWPNFRQMLHLHFSSCLASFGKFLLALSFESMSGQLLILYTWNCWKANNYLRASTIRSLVCMRNFPYKPSTKLSVSVNGRSVTTNWQNCLLSNDVHSARKCLFTVYHKKSRARKFYTEVLS